MNHTKTQPSEPKTDSRYRWKKVERNIYLRGRVYYIDYKVNGRRYKEAIGSSIQMARLVLMKRKVQAKEEKFFEHSRVKKIKFDEILKDFMERGKNINRPSTQERYRWLEKQMIKQFKGMRIEDITPTFLEKYRSRRLNQDKVSAGTVNKEMSFMKAMFNNAIKNDKVIKNPVAKLSKLRENELRTRYLTTDEIEMLLNSCPVNFRSVVETAILTGMRRGEIFNLKKKDIDFDRQVVMIENTKSGKRREIPMSMRLIDIIKKCYNNSNSEYLFTSRLGRPYKHTESLFRRCLQKAGIKSFRFHDLRHTFASHLVMSGADLVTVKELLGHSTINMTMRYSHLSQSHKRQAIEKLTERVSQKVPQ